MGRICCSCMYSEFTTLSAGDWCYKHRRFVRQIQTACASYRKEEHVLLEQGSSNGTMSRNIAKLVNAGYPQKQAISIVYRKTKE